MLDRTPFYAEGGGQIGDRGELLGPNGRLDVTDTQRVGDAIVHLGTLEGSLSAGDAVRAEVDEGRRWAAARNHTGTHLLHRALRDVLGEGAKQAGSWVGPEGLRFDFPASSATPREALREVERIVNAQIRRDATVTPEFMPIEQAQALGADMFFGEKYVPESVRVVQVDGFSKELCGGTHVASTGQIGLLLITGESSVGAGLRRIEAVTGEAATELVADRLEALRSTAQLLGEREEAVPQRVESLLARLREAEKAAKAPRAAAARLDAAAALHSAQEAGKTKVIIDSYADADAAALRGLADDLRGHDRALRRRRRWRNRRQAVAARRGQPRPRGRGIRLRRDRARGGADLRRRRRGPSGPRAGRWPGPRSARRRIARGRSPGARGARAHRDALTAAQPS